MRSNALSPSFGLFFSSAGRDRGVFMNPPPPSFAYQLTICKQGIMVSAARPYLCLILQHAAVWPGGDNGSIVASFKVCFHLSVRLSIHPTGLFLSSVTQADGFQCAALGWSASSSLMATFKSRIFFLKNTHREAG